MLTIVVNTLENKLKKFTGKPYQVHVQLAAKLLDPLECLPLDPMLNKSCNIERCGYKMHRIVANMILSQYLELKVSLL